MDRNIQEIIISYHLQEAGEEECRFVRDWIARSEENKKKSEEIRLFIERLSQKQDHRVNEDQAWSYLMHKIAQQEKRIQLSGRTKLLGIAASLAMLTCLAIGIRYIVYQNEQFVYSNPGMSPVSIILPDSSELWLNTGSELSFSGQYGNRNRKIKLKGEAYFHVKRLETQAFVVRTAGARIEVLGTSFNVRESLKGTMVILESGKLALYPRRHKRSEVVLNPGQRSFLQNGSREVKIEVHKDPNALSWKTGKLVFKDAPMDEVCHAIEVHYRVRLAGKESMDESVFTGTFHDESLVEVLRILNLTMDTGLTAETPLIPNN